MDPQALAPLTADYRYGEGPARYGGVQQRGGWLYAELRQPQAQRPVDPGWRKQREQAGKAWKRFCRTTWACEAEARQALAAFGQTVQATFLATAMVYARPRYGQRGRPAREAPPDQVGDHLDGALASALPSRQARIAHPRGGLLATHELDASYLPPQELLHGDTGQVHAERGFRFLKAPQFLASARARKKPERLRALLMGMTVCRLVYAAGEDRIRQALMEQGATFPNPKGPPGQNPTARWVLPSLVGSHLLLLPGQWPLVLNLTAVHPQLLRLLGKPDERL